MTTTLPTETVDHSLLGKWNALPLYGRIGVAVVAGVITGVLLGQGPLSTLLAEMHWDLLAMLDLPAKIILQLLGALAPPLILVAVIHTLMTTEVRGDTARRLAFLLLLNTTVAILIGLLVANTLQPGTSTKLESTTTAEVKTPAGTSAANILLQIFPKSLFGPLGDSSNVIGVIFIGIAFGIALRRVPNNHVRELVEVSFQSLIVVLHWVIHLVPFGVFAIVARIVGKEGFQPFLQLFWFVVAVLVALALQTLWYLLRIRTNSWVHPLAVLRGMRDALVMAFSTGSSTATMPVTYACLKEKVGIREESASMGALVGANFNNDGTALYEAMAALFVAQLLGRDLSLSQQVVVIFTSIIASVGAAGIPEAGMVTMTLVFNAVGLPTTSIAMLLTVDWFLDRCRTTINVLGDVNVSCLLDGKTKAETSSALSQPVGTENS